MYSGTCAIRHLNFPTSCDIPKICMVPKYVCFTVFRLLTDFVCLYIYEFWLFFCKIVRSSVILLLPLLTNIKPYILCYHGFLVGMFAIKTDHAANLHRHVDGWMTWSRYKLWLSWLGFTDIHTGIDKYYVSLGSQYMMDDLNKVTDRMM